MIEIYKYKWPKSDFVRYEICADRGNKFWGCPMEEIIGEIVNGVIEVDETCTDDEFKQIQMQWTATQIAEKF